LWATETSNEMKAQAGFVNDIVASFVRSNPHNELIWVAAPTLAMAIDAEPLAPSAVHTALRHVGATFATGRGAHTVQVGRRMFYWDHANPGRTLRPIINRASMADPATEVAGRRVPSAAFGLLAARQLAADFVTHARERFDHEPRFSAVLRALLAGVRALARAETLVDPATTDVLVVASQHSTITRAAVLVARHRGIASVYVPHAPMGVNRQYADLPTDYAGLRGDAEVEVYQRLGVRGDLAVVGDPAVPASEGVARRTNDVLFAVSPHGDRELRRQLAEVLQVVPGVTVVLHPSMGRIPQPYHGVVKTAPGPTQLHLLRGARALLQCRSGTGLEALALGIPVVEMSARDELPAYYYLAEPHVRFATTAAEIEAGLRAADCDDGSAGREWAATWCGAVGLDAVRRALDLLDAAAAHGPRGPLLDGWADLVTWHTFG
jgi:hypothetical protein